MSNIYRLPVPLQAALEELLDHLETLDNPPGGDNTQPDDAA